MLFFGGAFVLYAIVGIAKPVERPLVFWLSVAVVARLAVIFIFPSLSDDIYRFVWDGQGSINGVNPFMYKPSAIMTGEVTNWSPPPELFAKLNSPDYYTVYPPPSQFIFLIAATLSAGSVFWASVIIKVFLFVAEAITIWLMFKLLKPLGKQYRVLYYALNPLIIIEYCGNAHTEPLMIVGLVTMVFIFARDTRFKQLWPASLVFALATAFKLLPLLTIPALLHRLKVVKSIIWLVMTGVFLGLLTIPMFDAVATRTAESLDLYFRNFEFNASLYYIGRWIGYLTNGYNIIGVLGPILAGVSAIGILLFTALEHKPRVNTWPRAAMFSFLIYFLCSPVVHPWYIGTLVALSVFTYYRFSIVWSGMIFLSYSAYGVLDVSENLWLVGLEYFVVLLVLLYEIVFIKNRPLLTKR